MTSGSAAVPIATASVRTPARRGKATSILRCLVRARRQRRTDSNRTKVFSPKGSTARAPRSVSDSDLALGAIHTGPTGPFNSKFCCDWWDSYVLDLGKSNKSNPGILYT